MAKSRKNSVTHSKLPPKKPSKEPSPLEAELIAYIDLFGRDLPPYESNLRGWCKAHPQYEIDFAWKAWKVGVEVDGGQWNKFGGSHARDTHRRKNNAASLEGWLVLHYSGEMLKEDPLGVLEEIRRALVKRGW